MLVDVVPIRQAGRRLKGRELRSAVRADLTVRPGGDDVPPEWRHTLRAWLEVRADDQGSLPQARPELIDVRLLDMTDGVLRLIGVELGGAPVAGQLADPLRERVQIWRCRVVPPSESACTYQVVRLRCDGKRLSRLELAPAVAGDLSVVAGEGPGSSFRREGLTGNLLTVRGANGVKVGALLPIFDVHLLSIQGDQIFLAGIELASTRDEDRAEWSVTESVQIWRCGLVRPPSAVVLPSAAGAQVAVRAGSRAQPSVRAEVQLGQLVGANGL